MVYSTLKSPAQERTQTLQEVAPTEKCELTYFYGDHLTVEVVVQKVEQMTAKKMGDFPVCVAGSCASPPDDGDVVQQNHLLWLYRKQRKRLTGTEEKWEERRLMRKRRKLERHHRRVHQGSSYNDFTSEEEEEAEDEKKTVTEWLRKTSEQCGHEYDPLFFDKEAINQRLTAAWTPSNSP